MFLSYNLMLNSGKKIHALHDKKKNYSNSRVVWKKNFWTKKKNHNPPLQVKWSVPYVCNITFFFNMFICWMLFSMMCFYIKYCQCVYMLNVTFVKIKYFHCVYYSSGIFVFSLCLYIPLALISFCRHVCVLNIIMARLNWILFSFTMTLVYHIQKLRVLSS